MVHCHTVHLPIGALLIQRTMGWHAGKDETKATLQFYLLPATAASLLMMGHARVLLPQHLALAAAGLPPAAAGLALGVLVYRRVGQRAFARVLLGGMLCVGVVNVGGALRSWTSSE